MHPGGPFRAGWREVNPAKTCHLERCEMLASPRQQPSSRPMESSLRVVVVMVLVVVMVMLWLLPLNLFF